MNAAVFATPELAGTNAAANRAPTDLIAQGTGAIGCSSSTQVEVIQQRAQAPQRRARSSPLSVESTDETSLPP
jgi:hypothetical protein